MGWEAWATIACVALVLSLLVITRVGADVILLGALTILLLLGIVSPQEALSGLANEGMVTVGVLFVVAGGLRHTGAISWLVQALLGRPRSLVYAQARLMGPVVASSALMNNTPVVAMLVPAVNEWAKRYKLPVSKLMIPLSYAAILGGMCTLVGTSTNLVVNGLMLREGMPGMKMFDIAWVGLPCAIVGVGYIMVFSRFLLPDRKPVMSQLQDPRQYTVEMLVQSNSPMVGRTIEKAGLRQLPGMFLVEVERSGQILPAVSPQEVLVGGDRLVFAGIVESVVDLQKLRGLEPATDQVFKLDSPRSARCLIEAVVSDTCPLLNQTIRDGRFRKVYNAVVIAVARNGERIRRKIGDIILRPGDTLLLEATPAFVGQQQNSRDFFLVSRIEDSTLPRHERVVTALAILLAMVVAVTAGWLPMLQASMLAAGLMLITRCCTTTAARSSVDFQLLIVIAASFGLGKALEVSGAAAAIAHTLSGFSGGHAWLALAITYGVTMLFTELITNNAAAVLLFPIALATARDLNAAPMAFVVAVMMAASASFSTPIGYQTNLMVYGPGGYRYTDYLRIGIPLNLLVWGTTVLIAPVIWPF